MSTDPTGFLPLLFGACLPFGVGVSAAVYLWVSLLQVHNDQIVRCALHPHLFSHLQAGGAGEAPHLFPFLSLHMWRPLARVS